MFGLADGYMAPGLDPVQALVAGAAAQYARAVWIAGRLVAENGALPGFDMAAAHARAQEQFAQLVARYPDRTWKHPPAEEIFRRATGRPLARQLVREAGGTSCFGRFGSERALALRP